MTPKERQIALKEEPKYKGVSKSVRGKRYVTWIARHQHNGEKWTVTMNTQRDAALAYDKRLIQLGMQPVNILRKATAEAS
jgi:hypothetical protein